MNHESFFIENVTRANCQRNGVFERDAPSGCPHPILPPLGGGGNLCMIRQSVIPPPPPSGGGSGWGQTDCLTET
ncbi:hypothetical protein Sp245p_24825 (plasmid) [Azospirillum baldaniorum]|uniref:Uncharacterized protein n=1 Tax=Azospirillum baldaniorum TaxID=1064539 RepID=A0A9P1JYX7_9PROT|nr:hypothetical protein Sp245p_24825 [Azospirillum baldaniorum]CCD02355.1 protein of unknown function [Azospirillum baldaniorum]